MVFSEFLRDVFVSIMKYLFRMFRQGGQWCGFGKIFRVSLGVYALAKQVLVFCSCKMVEGL